MTKTPEEMTEEYCDTKQLSHVERLLLKDGFLAGYEAAKNQTACDFNDLMKDLSKRIEESCLPAMDAMEGRYLYQIKQLEARIKELEVELENWQENAKHGDEGL